MNLHYNNESTPRQLFPAQRRFDAVCKQRIVEEADDCSQPGESGARGAVRTASEHLTAINDDVWSLVDGKPVFDSSVNRQQRSKFYLYCRQNGQWPKLVSGFDPRKESKEFTPYERVCNVSKHYPPTILIHGTKDTDVPYEQSTLMDEQFKRHEVSHRLVTVKDAGHGLARGKAEEIEAAYEEALKFITKHVPGL